MQPVNEALMTDEEFLTHVEKSIEQSVRDCGNIELRGATIERLCKMIRLRDNLMHQQIQISGKVHTRSMENIGISQDKLSHNNPYLNLRKEFKRNEDGTYQVTLSVVNIPCTEGSGKWTMGDAKDKINFKTTREELIKHLDLIVKRGVIGETDQSAVRWRAKNGGEYDIDKINERYGVIDPSKVAGTLNSYEISGIRDGSGALVITGNVTLTPEAALMVESGNYIFGIRSLVNCDGKNRVIDKIIGFDMFPVHELVTTI